MKTNQNLKNRAVELRKQGKSLRFIAAELNTPKSTMRLWIKNISLTEEQKTLLQTNKAHFGHTNGLREKAIAWHNKQKQLRIKIAKETANKSLITIPINDKSILRLALAMLYLGEGSKGSGTSLGNSDPLILKFFIKALETLYPDIACKLKCDLHIRADQSANEIKKYWSHQLNLPLDRFRSVSIDSRSIGKPTYPHYKGVCVLECGNIALQRELVYLSRRFCSKITNLRAVSSADRASD